MSDNDKLLSCKYGSFVSTICNGSHNSDVSWDDMRAALLRVINSEKSPIRVEELPHTPYSMSGRNRIAMLLRIYEIIESDIQVPRPLEAK